MHNAGAFFRRDEIFADDQLVLSFLVLNPVERPLVLLGDQLRSGKGAHAFPPRTVVLAEDCGRACKREDYRFVIVAFLLVQLDVLE